ncbi:MAG: restriction endonuclease subunit S [Magnetococcales bacterium]|nr:restriction endonuclease subunit S [Magnetococcales bacterium]
MSWPRKPLDQLGFVGRGKSRHRPRNDPTLYGGEHPFIQTADIMASEFRIQGYSKTYSDIGLAQSKLWTEATLCMTIAGENTAETAILDFPACFPDSIVGFIPDPEKSDIRFVKYSLDLMKRDFKSISKGATQDNLSLAKLLSFGIPSPPLGIQKRIGDILSAYDDLIENNRRRIRLLEDAARLLYREWFVYFRFPGHEHVKIIDGVPEGWSRGVVSDFYDTASGGTPSRKNPEFYGGEIKWVKTQELQDGFLFDTEEHITEDAVNKSAAKLFPAYTVLIAMYGATIGQVGVVVGSSTCNQACCAVTPKAEGTNYEHALLFFLSNKDGLRNLGQGAAQKNISQQVIRGYEMVLPGSLILQMFQSHVKPFLEQIRTLQEMNHKLRAARDLLLPRLMNGEIAV